MKAAVPSSNQHLELSVYADGQKLKEFALPGATTDRNILECFVPVRVGEKLTVKGRFEGTCLQASFDLVVDGSFLKDARLERTSTQPRKRDFMFEKVYDCPAEKEGWTSTTEPPIDVYAGHLHVEDIGDMVNISDIENSDENSERPGVGSIQVVANVQDFEGEHRLSPEWDIHGGGWLRRTGKNVRPSGIKPDYAIEVRHISDEKIPQKRSKIHRDHGQKDARYGIVPWARFVFYYRNKDSIERAGCKLRDEQVRELRRDLANPVVEEAHGTKPKRKIDTSWDSQVPFSNIQLPKLTRLGGDFSSQMPPSLQQATDRYARKAPTERDGIRGGAAEAESDTGSQLDSLFVSEHTSPRDTSTGAVSHEGGNLKHPSLFNSVSTSASHSRTNKVTSPTTTPDPNDMAKLDQYIIYLPSLDQIADFIGTNGSCSLEISKYFGKIAKENGFPANGSVRNKLKAEYNLLVRQVAHVDLTLDNISLKKEYMPLAIKQEKDQEDAEGPIESMPKQQHNKPPPAPMVARSIEKSRSTVPSPAVSDRANVLKRAASKSSTPDTPAKKAKLVVANTAELEAARRRIEENRRITEQLMKEHESKQAKKAARKAQKAAEKQKEAEELQIQEQLEANARAIEIMEEEARAQQAQIDALKAVAEDDDDDEEDSDDSEDDENPPDANAIVAAEAEAEAEEMFEDFDAYMPEVAKSEAAVESEED